MALVNATTALKLANDVMEFVLGGSTGSLSFPAPGDSSAGDFWTVIKFHTWATIKEEDANTDSQRQKLGKLFAGTVQLPMPINLGTQYTQNFQQADNMQYDRTGSTLGKLAGATGAGVMRELFNGGANALTLNNSAKMSLGSVVNQNLGLVYEGPALREHSFSWRMTPKSKEEQKSIERIIRYIKAAATPEKVDAFGGAIGNNDEKVESLKAAGGSEQAVEDEQTLGEAITAFAGASRLSIPPTISVQFFNGGSKNRHLFEIGESFITNVEVNYTPAGGWQAYEDGAPMETQLTLTFKEISTLNQADIIMGA